MEIDREAPVGLEREIGIAAPTEVVWDVLTSVDDWPRWFSEGESAAIAGTVALGTTIRMKARGTGAITARIETAEAPHVLAWTSRTFGIPVISVWRLDRRDGGTRVEKGGVDERLPGSSDALGLAEEARRPHENVAPGPEGRGRAPHFVARRSCLFAPRSSRRSRDIRSCRRPPPTFRIAPWLL